MIGRFRRQPHHRAKGAVGEAEAARWLARRGYRIVERNVRERPGEIDLVALDGPTLCFVEVKVRTSGAFGPAVLAVDHEKRRRLALAAAAYLGRRPHDGPCRFDVLGIDLEDGEPRYTLLQDAFQVDG